MMQKTLLVLGAGASKDFCPIFPTGLELIKDINYHFLTEKKYPVVSKDEGIYLSAMVNQIVKIFGVDDEMLNIIKNKLWNIQLHYEFEYLRNPYAKQISIDRFIEQEIYSDSEKEEDRYWCERSENDKHLARDILKYCIYYLIKGTEGAYQNGKYDLTTSWIYKLAQKLSINSPQEINENLYIASFNYDRIFEAYFAKSIALLTAQRFKFNNVQYVYGSLGSLNDIPIKLRNDDLKSIPTIFKNIGLIGQERVKEIRIDNPEQFNQVHFIGFGYDETNLSIINPKRFLNATIKGTAYKYSESDMELLYAKYGIVGIDKTVSQYIECL